MERQTTRQALKISFPVAATWFGALFGPSLLSGAYVAAYFLPYGSYAIILPFVAFTVICVFAALAANITRTHHSYDYASFAKAIYGKAYKFLMPLLDYDILMAMCLGGASCIATVSLLLGQLGVPPLLSALLFSALALVITVFGESAVRRFSSIMTFIMMLAFVFFAGLLISQNTQAIAPSLSNWKAYDGSSIPKGMWKAILLGLSNFGMVGGSLCAVEQKVTTAKECRLIGWLSYIMNSVLMAVGAFMLMLYCPGVLGSATPTVSIMSGYIAERFPMINVLYYILMAMALITSAVPQAHAVVARVNRMVSSSEENHSAKKKRTLLIGAVYFLVCSLLSMLGLMAIVSKGYSFSAWLHLFLLAIPIALWHIRKIPRIRKRWYDK